MACSPPFPGEYCHRGTSFTQCRRTITRIFFFLTSDARQCPQCTTYKHAHSGLHSIHSQTLTAAVVVAVVTESASSKTAPPLRICTKVSISPCFSSNCPVRVYACVCVCVRVLEHSVHDSRIEFPPLELSLFGTLDLVHRLSSTSCTFLDPKPV